MLALKNTLIRLINDGPFQPKHVVIYRYLLGLSVLTVTGYAVMNTVPDFWATSGLRTRPFVYTALVILGFDYGLRMFAATQFEGGSSLRRYLFSTYGIFDFLAVIPWIVIELFALPTDFETIFSVVLFLKLARFSPALETLGAVIVMELRPLLSTLFIVALLILFTATMLYFAERNDNAAFSSVPMSMWWSVVTLATVGYGDVVPATVLGRVLGGGVAILGLCMFALPASILASGFTEEMRRQNFVSTWHLVSKVPFFSRLHANQIAEVAALLRVFRAVRGEILMREGDIGENMYFIAQGQVEVQVNTATFTLKSGDFFGEIALLRQCPRTATVRAVTRCQLLMLDVRDFQKFVAGYPNLLDEINDVASSRMNLPSSAQTSDPA